MKIEFQEVPPPNEVPVDQIGETMGLVSGLKPERTEGGWRCVHCNDYQIGNGYIVWVPDSVHSTDSAEAISNQCRLNAYNGSKTGWCLKCAKALGKPAKIAVRSFFGLFR